MPGRTRKSKQLMKTLTDNPALPAFVQQLHAPVLKRLIDHVGLHDAGALIALTSTDQLREIFEVSLWESLVPGQAERLRPEKFLEWLDVMLEVGPAFAVERLIELGEDFVVANIASLIRVIDAGVMAEHQADSERCICGYCALIERGVSFELIADYIVVAVHEDEWDSVRTTLLELDTEDADFLRRVLARCCRAPTVRGAADLAETLLEDETYAREQRREQGGFVTPQIAAMLLKIARTAPREELVAQRDYDDVSRRHFDQLAAARTDAVRDPDAEETDEDANSEAAITPVQLRALEEVLVKAEIVGEQSTLRLSGPSNTREESVELQARLDRLQVVQPDLFAARLAELVFLANVLMAGSFYQGGRFTEAEAARAALACANLGLDYLLEAEAISDAQRHAPDALTRSEFIDATLELRPGIVRLFQIGWNLIQDLPMRAATHLLDVLRSEHVREQLRHKRWMLDEIETAVNDPDILRLIEQGEFADVADNLVLLRLVLDARACHCLQTLIADFPRYPLQLNLGFQRDAQAVTNESGYLTTMRQLQRVETFLDDLDGLLKL